MKKLLLIAFIALVAYSANAQGIKFGLAGSPQVSWFKIDNTDLENDGAKLGFTYGIMIEYAIGSNERYNFSSGVFISHTGGKYSIPDSSIAGKFVRHRTLNLQYIEIPVTFRLRTNEIGYITYFGQFGVLPGLKIRSRYDETYEPNPLNISVENERFENAIVINMGLFISGGIEYALSESTALLFGLYFNNGFTNVINDDDKEKISVNNLGLRVGVLF